LLAILKYISRPKSAAVKDIDIDIADILDQKYRYHIDISKCDIDPPPIAITFILSKFINILGCFVYIGSSVD